MTTSKDLLQEAMRATKAARDIHDHFEGQPMPAEAAKQIQALLDEASRLRSHVETLKAWESQPVYKHDFYPSDAGRGIATGDQQRKAFFEFIATGDRGVMRKAALIEDATGQNLVPIDFAGTIIKQLGRLGVMRGLAYVHPTRRDRVDVGAITVGTPTWGRVEVTGGPPADALGTASKQQIVVHELSALAKIGVDELDDTDNLEEVIRMAVAAKFGEVEDDSFVAGTGTDQPWGLSHGVTQGISATVDNTPTPDDLKKLTFAVPAQFRRFDRSVFVWHSKVEQAVALMKDNTGNYLMQPSANLGEPPTFMGYRWFTSDALPDPSTAGISQKSVIFGDVYSGYVIAQRTPQMTIQRLSELFAAEGKIGLLVKLRVGGDVVRPSALATYTL